MSIITQTYEGRDIDNTQVEEFSAYEMNLFHSLKKKWGQRVSIRAHLTPRYNCHGMTFATRRTRITESAEVMKILSDDRYEKVDAKEALPGDVVVYFDENGDPNHSGVVVENGAGRYVPLIVSKWGAGYEAVHNAPECPYGPSMIYYRCCL